VFMVTAYDNEEYHRKAVDYGCDDYLTKPIDFGLLRERLLA
jgi:two-component system, chemotaxis family, chemotaxis protein CheY